MEEKGVPRGKVQVIRSDIKASISLAIAHATFKNVDVTRNEWWPAIAVMISRFERTVIALTVQDALSIRPIICERIYHEIGKEIYSLPRLIALYHVSESLVNTNKVK